MSLKPLQQQGVVLDWKAWKMPINAAPPEKPEGYGAEVNPFIENLLEETGLTIKAPTKKRDTFLAHVGGKYAKAMGRFNEYQIRVFQAVWEKDEDIENVDVLAAIAKEVNLDGIEFKEALTNTLYLDMVEQDFKEATDNKLWTIPSYIGDGGEIQVHHFKDLPNVETLKRLLN